MLENSQKHRSIYSLFQPFHLPFHGGRLERPVERQKKVERFWNGSGTTFREASEKQQLLPFHMWNDFGTAPQQGRPPFHPRSSRNGVDGTGGTVKVNNGSNSRRLKYG